ncbi:meteorin-like protein [Ictalurus punctatus]|uniref:Meteorin-like protein n=1 Tax=Ictalurus punctatus TaxID=7998 RepID=A0A2D0Q2V1_ICTPU|nr:meteorin-like protein [Ictalurus punctatus]
MMRMRKRMICALLVACLCASAVAQYSSDQCSWRGSGLTHEAHARDVEQVYLRCSEGSLEWLYPTGAIIVNLRPNTFPEAGAETRLSACVKPRADTRGASMYVERAGVMRMLLSEEEQAAGRVRCFSLNEGALFVQASTHTDISKRVTAFQYELIRGERATAGETLSTTDPCTPCTDDEILMAVCTSDFVVRGSIESVVEDGDDEQQASVLVSVSRLYRQKRRVFEGRGRSRWSGRVRVPRRCAIQVEQRSDSGVGQWAGLEEFLFTGAVRFGEARLGCALQYRDFLLMYQAAVESGRNPCHMDVN